MPDGCQERVVVCDGCPFGCVVTVTLDAEGSVAHLEGNTCERAWEHAAALALQPGGRSAGKGANEGLQAESAAEGKASLAAETAKAPVRGYRAFRREHARKRAESR